MIPAWLRSTMKPWKKRLASSHRRWLTKPIDETAAPVERRHDVDWLRVLAFSLVFLYHCGRFFDRQWWHIKNSTTSPVADALKGIVDLWGMALIFLISGASIHFALRSGKAVRFLRDRASRLLVPLALGILVLAPPQIYLTRLTHGEFHGSFLDFLPVCFRDWRTWDGNFAWSGVHLWYLEDLFLFTLVLLPLFVALKGPLGRRFTEVLGRLSARPGAIFLWVLPLALLLILADPFGILRADLPVDLIRLIVYWPFLVFGFLVFSDGRIQRAIVGQRNIALVIAVGLTLAAPALGSLPGLDSIFLLYALAMFLASLLSWSTLVAILGYGMRHLGAHLRVLSYANEAVLPFYVLHHPVILTIGYFIIPLPLPILLKYLVIAASAFSVTLGLYELGIRPWGPVRWAFGLKPRKALPAELVAQPAA
jgi:glucan biosynthesis protein C